MNVSVNSNNSLHFFRTYLCAHLYTVYPFLWKLIFKFHFSMRFCEIKSHPEANGASTFFNCTERALNRQERCLHRTARRRPADAKRKAKLNAPQINHTKKQPPPEWCGVTVAKTRHVAEKQPLLEKLQPPSAPTHHPLPLHGTTNGFVLYILLLLPLCLPPPHRTIPLTGLSPTHTHTTTTTMNDCGLVVSRRGVGHSPHTHTFWRVCSDWCEQQQRGAPSARGSNGSVSVARLRDFDPFITRNTPWARAIRCMMPHTIADDDDDGDGEDAVRKKKEPTHHRNRSTASPPVVSLLPSDALSLSLTHKSRVLTLLRAPFLHPCTHTSV